MEPKFYFTKSERRGLLLLSFLITLIISTKAILPTILQEELDPMWMEKLEEFYNEDPKTEAEISEFEMYSFDPNEITERELVQMGVSTLIAERIVKYRSKGGRFNKPEDLSKIYGLSPEEYERLEPYIHMGSTPKFTNKYNNPKQSYSGDPVDPNKADSTQLVAIGLRPGTVKNVLNYRRKGGVIKSLEDFSKIYGMDAEQLERSKKHLIFPNIENNFQPFSYKNLIAAEKSPEERALRLDINSATEAEWEYLRGVGTGSAKRIVEYREKLGGFHNIEQVKEVWGVTDSMYMVLQPHLVLETPPGKIKINLLDIETLARHPYIDWKKAKLLVHYREQHGNYRQKKDLLKIKVLTEEWVDKIIVYLDFEPST